MDIPLGESEYPDGWVAAHHGPPWESDEDEETRSQRVSEKMRAVKMM